MFKVGGSFVMMILALVCIILFAGVDQFIKVWAIDNLKILVV